MLLTEYNEAETMELIREASERRGMKKGRKEGREEGRKEGRKEGRRKGRKEGREKGREEERITGIRSLMGTLKLTPAQAMDALRIPASEQPQYLAKL